MIFDIVILALVLLLFIIGFSKGFAKSVLGFITFAGAIFIAIFLTPYLTESIGNLGGIFQKISNILIDKFSTLGAIATTPVTGGQIVIDGVATDLSDLLGKFLLPASWRTYLIGIIPDGSTLASSVGQFVGYKICSVISGVIIFIAAFIVFKVISIIIRKFIKQDFLRGIDRVLGGLFGLFKSYLIISLLFWVFDLMSGFSFMQNVLAMLRKSFVAHYLFDYNFITLLLQKVVKINLVAFLP
ncbi:MAG: CvpA family protein, partial [Clostridia bacterium]